MWTAEPFATFSDSTSNTRACEVELLSPGVVLTGKVCFAYLSMWGGFKATIVVLVSINRPCRGGFGAAHPDCNPDRTPNFNHTLQSVLTLTATLGRTLAQSGTLIHTKQTLDFV